MTRASSWTYLGLAALVVVLWFATLGERPLFNTDEGRYAEIPREMLAGGNWIIPHLDGLVYVEKPPLQYWASALSLTLLGENEVGARFYTALCALLAVLAAALGARALWGAQAALRTAAMLPSMMLFLLMGQILTLDMSLTFYMTVALAAFLAAQRAAGGSQRAWMLLAWGASALGVLTKGLVAAAVPAAVLVLYSLYARDFSPWRRLHAAPGAVLFALIAVPWYWLAARAQPGFLEFFFVHEHLARYLTPSADREQVWWFFVPVCLLGSLPWTLPALRALGRARRRIEGFDAALFLRIWVLFVLVFFSLSDSKLIPYVLPLFPALALLTASLPEADLERDLARTAVLTVAMGIALALTCLLAPAHIAPSERSSYFLALQRPLAQIAALLAASGVYVLAQRRRGVTRSAVFLGVGWCLSGLLFVQAAAAVAPVYSGIELARALPRVPPEVPIYSVGTYDQTLPFYWRRTVRLVAYRGELDFGLRQDPAAEIPTVEEFTRRWEAEPAAYAVMDKKTFELLSSRGVPMREIAHDVNRVLVAR
ncbi:MAG TPA: glycosyltransferase family 39 protein [Steroidobacteraceae bacterium]|nr:glycosyltransferase family 39 protein [Steroidobacteraceae bacterium]